MAIPIATTCPTAMYGTLNRLTPPTRLQTPSADAIKLLWVQTAESHRTYLPSPLLSTKTGQVFF